MGSLGPLYSNSNMEMWKHLWKLKLPPKISIFLWKFLHDRLPTNSLISFWLPFFYKSCKFYGEIETLRHLFFQCPRAIQTCILFPLILHSSMILGSTVRECWSELISSFDASQKLSDLEVLMLFLLGNLWKSRNNFIFRDQFLPPHDIFALTTHDWEEFLFNMVSSLTPQMETHQNSPSWCYSPCDLIKVNFDIAFNVKKNFGVIVALDQDDQGQPHGWIYKRVYDILGPLF